MYLDTYTHNFFFIEPRKLPKQTVLANGLGVSISIASICTATNFVLFFFYSLVSYSKKLYLFRILHSAWSCNFKWPIATNRPINRIKVHFDIFTDNIWKSKKKKIKRKKKRTLQPAIELNISTARSLSTTHHKRHLSPSPIFILNNGNFFPILNWIGIRAYGKNHSR